MVCLREYWKSNDHQFDQKSHTQLHSDIVRAFGGPNQSDLKSSTKKFDLSDRPPNMWFEYFWSALTQYCFHLKRGTLIKFLSDFCPLWHCCFCCCCCCLVDCVLLLMLLCVVVVVFLMKWLLKLLLFCRVCYSWWSSRCCCVCVCLCLCEHEFVRVLLRVCVSRCVCVSMLPFVCFKCWKNKIILWTGNQNTDFKCLTIEVFKFLDCFLNLTFAFKSWHFSKRPLLHWL